jgi:hypothetical protein
MIRFIKNTVILILFLFILTSNATAQTPIEPIAIYTFYDTRLDILCVVTENGYVSCLSLSELTNNAKKYIKILIDHEKITSKNKLVPGIITIPKPVIPE